MVCAEALRCGANVVGSDAGGIAEVIGADSVAPLGDAFVDTLAEKALSYLSARSVPATSDPDSVPGAHRQTLSEDFSWSRTAARELDFLIYL